ncbi:MAG: hypothetical protein N4A50_02235 [Vallitalea sp.]|nr:hypothetical protein [Vallitalea sp.]
MNSKDIMDFSILKQGNDSNECFMENYSINYLKDKIAYVFTINRNEYIYIYDIKSKKWQHIWNEYKLIDYYGFDVLWDKNDNLYFDSWGIILDKNNMVIEPREIYREIYKYNDNTQYVNLLINDYNLHSASLDYENILIENCENYFPEYYVYNFNEQKIIQSFQENFIDGKISWANNSKYIAYYDKDLKTIYIYSILSSKTYEQNINHIIGNSYLTEIRAEDDYFIFFIGRYDSGYTYSIKIKNLNEIK